MANVRWLQGAKEDIERLHAFLRDKSPKAAKRAIRAIKSGAGQLARHPLAGRSMGDATGRRELFVSFAAGAYVLRYILDGDTPVIIRVWHSREQR